MNRPIVAGLLTVSLIGTRPVAGLPVGQIAVFAFLAMCLGVHARRPYGSPGVAALVSRALEGELVERPALDLALAG